MPAPPAALARGCGVLSARAAEPPDNVAAEVAEAVQSCKDLDGVPNADAVLSVDDLNCDGGGDWIADYAKLKCEGGINQMCGANGCTLQIFLWDGGAAWTLVFERLVRSYRRRARIGRRTSSAARAFRAAGVVAQAGKTVSGLA